MKLTDKQINDFINKSTKRISDMIRASNNHISSPVKVNVNKTLIENILHEELTKLLG